MAWQAVGEGWSTGRRTCGTSAMYKKEPCRSLRVILKTGTVLLTVGCAAVSGSPDAAVAPLRGRHPGFPLTRQPVESVFLLLSACGG